MIVIPANESPARRWLAHLVRIASGSIHPGNPFDEALAFEEAAVLALARRHRVAPLLHLAFAKGMVGDPLPASFRVQCRTLYAAALRRNTVALEIGSCVLTELASGGIPAAPLGGWALVDGRSRAYDDPGARPIDELAVMVRSQDLGRAREALGSLGFDPVTDRTAGRLRGGSEAAFHRCVAGTHLFLELHHAWAGVRGLLREPTLSGDRFLDALCEVVRGREGFLVPTRLGQMLLLAAHAASHAFGQWIWLIDLHRLATTAPLEWEELVRSACQLRVGRAVCDGLTAARELLGTPVPKGVLSELAPEPAARPLPPSVASGRPWYRERGPEPGVLGRIRGIGGTP